MPDTMQPDAPAGGFDGGPKGRMRSAKAPLHLWPLSATALGSLGMLEGATKYGRHNFRAEPIRASDFHAAVQRHMGAWYEGSDQDPNSGLLHLGNALSAIATLVEGILAGQFIDDRPPTVLNIEELLTKVGADASRLRLHQEVAERAGERKPPVHYTKSGAESGVKFAP